MHNPGLDRGYEAFPGHHTVSDLDQLGEWRMRRDGKIQIDVIPVFGDWYGAEKRL